MCAFLFFFNFICILYVYIYMSLHTHHRAFYIQYMEHHIEEQNNNNFVDVVEKRRWKKKWKIETREKLENRSWSMGCSFFVVVLDKNRFYTGEEKNKHFCTSNIHNWMIFAYTLSFLLIMYCIEYPVCSAASNLFRS